MREIGNKPHLKAALGIGAMKIATLPLSILLSIVLARALGPDDYGRYAFALSLATILALPAGVGINGLVLRETARAQADGDYSLMSGVSRRALQFLVLYTGLIWLGGLGYYLAVRGSADPRSMATLLFALLMSPIISLLAVQAGVMQGLRKPVVSQMAQLLFRPSLSLLFVLAALALVRPFQLDWAFSTQFAATLLALAGSFYFARRLYPREAVVATPRYTDRAWLRAVAPFSLIAAANTFNTEIGILLLGTLGSEADTAALRVAQSGAQLLIFPLFITNIILSGNAARMLRTGEIDELAKMTRRFAKVAFAATALAGIPLIVFAEPILRIVFGPEYAEVATLPLQILAVGYMLDVMFGPVAWLLSMGGREMLTLRGQVLSLVIAMTLAALLIPSFGAVGAAIGLSSGIVIGQGYLTLLCRRVLGFRPMAF